MHAVIVLGGNDLAVSTDISTRRNCDWRRRQAPPGATSVNRYFNSKELRLQGASCLEAVGFAASFSSALFEYALTPPRRCASEPRGASRTRAASTRRG